MNNRWIPLWDFHGEAGQHSEIKQRTPNFLERYNREFNRLFLAAQPGFATYVEISENEGDCWVQKWKDARHGKVQPAAQREEICWPEILIDYMT